ncbi:MAG: hypothetical protein K6B40_05385 [Firmicutes bacterium]|nr:hypothetical protein [Bacillota bacterium]
MEETAAYRPWLNGSVAELPPRKQLEEIERRLAAEYLRRQQTATVMLKVDIRVALQIDEATYREWLREPTGKEAAWQKKRRRLLLKWQDLAEQLTIEFACRDKKGSIGAFAAKAVYGYGEKDGEEEKSVSIEEFLGDPE